MKITIIPALILYLGFAISCGSSEKHEHDSSEESKTDHAETEHQNEHDESTTTIRISLNNGAKWVADASTFTGMQRLEKTIHNFDDLFLNPTAAEYNKLGESLANIDKDIISQCSMEGKDHDQLHILLAPMFANVDVIKNGTDLDKMEENIKELSNSIDVFFEHFAVN